MPFFFSGIKCYQEQRERGKKHNKTSHIVTRVVVVVLIGVYGQLPTVILSTYPGVWFKKVWQKNTPFVFFPFKFRSSRELLTSPTFLSFLNFSSFLRLNTRRHHLYVFFSNLNASTLVDFKFKIVVLNCYGNVNYYYYYYYHHYLFYIYIYNIYIYIYIYSHFLT